MPELDHSLIAALTGALAGLPPRRRLLVGVSGGLDSLLLLRAAHRHVQAMPGTALLALHVHHGLSPQADAWARHVEDVCAALAVPCRTLRVDVDRSRPSREAAARDARHAAMTAQLQPGDALLLAHHADDQAETLLLRLLRGSGLGGLAAMRPARPVAGIPDVWMLRPWLAIPRARLADAAAHVGLAWVEDESNLDTAFDRNHLRRDVLPLLRARWPAFAITAAHTARRLANAEALLDEYLDGDLAPLLSERADHAGPVLGVAGLLVHRPARQRALLRRWLRHAGAPLLEEAWLQQLLQLASARIDSEGELRVGGWEMHRFRGQLYAFPQLPPMRGVQEFSCELRGEIDLGPACGRLQVLPADAVVGLPLAGVAPGTLVNVGFRRGGETLRPNAGSGSRPLKKVLQEHGVPPWLRARLPLVSCRGRLVAVGDLLADAAFTPTDVSPASLRLRWIAPGRARG